MSHDKSNSAYLFCSSSKFGVLIGLWDNGDDYLVWGVDLYLNGELRIEVSLSNDISTIFN